VCKFYFINLFYEIKLNLKSTFNKKIKICFIYKIEKRDYKSVFLLRDRFKGISW